MEHIKSVSAKEVGDLALTRLMSDKALTLIPGDPATTNSLQRLNALRRFVIINGEGGTKVAVTATVCWKFFDSDERKYIPGSLEIIWSGVKTEGEETEKFFNGISMGSTLANCLDCGTRSLRDIVMGHDCDLDQYLGRQNDAQRQRERAVLKLVRIENSINNMMFEFCEHPLRESIWYSYCYNSRSLYYSQYRNLVDALKEGDVKREEMEMVAADQAERNGLVRAEIVGMRDYIELTRLGTALARDTLELGKVGGFKDCLLNLIRDDAKRRESVTALNRRKHLYLLRASGLMDPESVKLLEIIESLNNPNLKLKIDISK